MGSRFHPRLATWFDEGLACGKFDVPSGRHIILNEFPRLMPESRLLASAGVDRTSLREFLLTVNPNVISIPDGSAEGMRQQLALECDQLPGLRKVFTRLPPYESLRGLVRLHATIGLDAPRLANCQIPVWPFRQIAEEEVPLDCGTIAPALMPGRQVLALFHRAPLDCLVCSVETSPELKSESGYFQRPFWRLGHGAEGQVGRGDHCGVARGWGSDRPRRDGRQDLPR